MQLKHRVHITVQRWGDEVYYQARCHEHECAWSFSYEDHQRAISNGSFHCLSKAADALLIGAALGS